MSCGRRTGGGTPSIIRLSGRNSKMKRHWLFILLGCCGLAGAEETPGLTGDYLGQAPPADSAVVFAPDIVSRAESHGRLVVSPDGNELFWNRVSLSTNETRLYHVVRDDSVWSSPELCPFALNGWTANPVFTPDGEKLFFEYRAEPHSDWELRIVEKTNGVWTEPRKYDSAMKGNMSFTSDGKIVYSDAMANMPWGNGIYSADYSEAGLSNVQPLPAAINSANTVNYTPFISADGSCLLFSSNRPVTGPYDTNMHLSHQFHREWRVDHAAKIKRCDPI